MVVTSKPAKISGLSFFEAKWGYIFISPWIIGFFAFLFFPMIGTLILSFTNFNLVNAEGLKFVGLSNYYKMFGDPIVYSALWITLKFTIVALPIGIIYPVLLAALMTAKGLWGRQLFRTLFYLPYIVPMVSAAWIWRGFLNTDAGWLNYFLRWFGLPTPDWLFTPFWIMPSLLIISLWGVGNAMLTMISSMQSISDDMYDAAAIDGAGPVTTFIFITIPLISPIIFYNVVLSMIGLFNYFLIPQILKGVAGDPGGSTMFYNLYLYKTFFTYQDMAYGATLAWGMFVLVLACTLFLFGTSKYWVYYTADER